MNEKLKNIRVGLDIDGCLACFSSGVISHAKKLGLEAKFPSNCKEVNSWDMSEDFSKVMKDLWRDEEFWLNLPVLDGTLPLPFEPYVYITSRPISGAITKQWLNKNGFPNALVVTVSNPKDKLEHAINLKLDLYIDDLYSTVREMRDNGIEALLMKAAYQVGHAEECEGLPTIKNLSEVLNYV